MDKDWLFAADEYICDLSVAILCGGQSRRMGRDKARLAWNGQEMLDHIAGTLSALGEIFLSADSGTHFEEKPWPVVVDQYPGCGPLGGVCSAMEACKTPLLFVVSCDMPFVTGQTGRLLQSRMEPGVDAAVPRDGSGRIHPLCAVYRRDAAPILRRQLQSGNLRMRDALECLRTLYVQDLPGRVLCNVNTPEEYRKASQSEC